MHKNNIVHRDIKPENILIDSMEDLSVKLTDFGFATYFDDDELLDEILGSPIYMPPEIVMRHKYDSKVDVWSAGVVTYILLCGRPPFTGLTKEEVYAAIQFQELPLHSQEWFKVSDEAKDFLMQTLNKDPFERFSAEEALRHPYLNPE